MLPLTLLDLFDDESVEHWSTSGVNYRIDAILAPSFHRPRFPPPVPLPPEGLSGLLLDL